MSESQSSQLVDIATSRYRLGQSDEGEPFAVAECVPGVARMMRGSRSLRSELAADYHRNIGKVPSQGALTDALAVLEGMALIEDRETLFLRVAPYHDGIVLDLGDEDGNAVVITADGWQVIESSPGPMFRRTRLTGRMPIPTTGDLDALRGLVTVSDEDWPMVVAWMVAALVYGIPHPILGLFGMQGTAKSTAARFLSLLIDPSPAPLRSPPRDADGWAVAARGSWVVALDNVSTVPPWFSDTLCKVVTGDGVVKRALYSDDDLAVLSFRRVMILTSIDAGTLRGDLADRIVPVELDRIDPLDRREEQELDLEFYRLRPELLGGLLDITASTLKILPDVRPARLGRMADFARICAAVDQVIGGNAFHRYAGTALRLSEDVVESDPVAVAVRAFATAQEWTGTASDLQKMVVPDDEPKAWPKLPHHFAGRLKRVAPALRDLGIVVTFDRSGDTRSISVVDVRETASSASSASPNDAHDAHDAHSGDLTLCSFCSQECDPEFGDHPLCLEKFTP